MVEGAMTLSPRTLTERIERAAEARPHGTVTFIDGDDANTVRWRQLLDEARVTAGALQARGVQPGDRVALLGPTSRSLVTAIEATWLAGATVMVLPLPMRMSSIEEFVRQTRVRIRAADAAVVVIDSQLAEFVTADPTDPPLITLDDLMTEAGRLGPSGYDRPEPDPDSLAILQFTSGSTSEPKGVMLPHHVVCANLDGIAEATGLDRDDDVLVSWLPLYHDMGLVGKLGIPITTGTDLVLAGPQDFMSSPARWMQWMSDYGGTASAAPNFAYALATRALRRLEGLDLSRWRIALNGAEPVDPATVAAFIDAAEPHGLRPSAVFPAFGMAEVAIAGTFPEPGRGLVVDAVDRRVLETERLAVPVDHDATDARHLARLGRPVPGLEIRVVDPESGRPLAEREAGELEIRGTSLSTGYWREPEATARVFRPDGWFRTGDLAYLVDGELVLCGRIKDLIIVGGRNVYPEDVERAVGGVDGVRAGNVIAFGVEGRRQERLVVVAESRADDRDLVIKHISAAVRDAVGLGAHDIVLVEPGSLPKTSSGKLQRSRCKQQYTEGSLRPLQLVG
jgi:fatty-acyl-CoA synthase